MQAVVKSSLDDPLKDSLAKGSLVYGGESVGSMIASPNLKYYDRKKSSVMPNGYDSRAVWDGLGHIDEYITAHYSEDGDNKPYLIDRIKQLQCDDNPYATLRDSDVLIVNDSKREILR